MQNMIRLKIGGKEYNCFFSINRESKDFEGISLRDPAGEPLLEIYDDELDAIKDVIAQEIILTSFELQSAMKAGTFLPC